jgi:hypothetical protein
MEEVEEFHGAARSRSVDGARIEPYAKQLYPLRERFPIAIAAAESDGNRMKTSKI